MPILNYTTKIDEMKTVAEIQKILAKAGASNIMIDFKNTLPTAITFAIEVNTTSVNFRLPCKAEKVFEVLLNDREVEKRFKSEEQAYRVSWRILKDWIEAQMALIRVNMAELPEVFLPYAITGDGTTLYTRLKEQRFLLNNNHN